MSYAGFLTFVFFMMSSEYEGQVHGCKEEVTKIFARIGGAASFKFSVGNIMIMSGSLIVFKLNNASDGVSAQISYVKGSHTVTNQTLPKVTVQQASWNGEIKINIHGIVTGDKGLYTLYSPQISYLFCSFLYIFGKPQKPVVSHDNSNVLGRNSTLSCNSVSTTYPTNHTLSFNYSWVVNDTRNPVNTRYKYGSSRKTLTIMPVAREDANKIFKCIATESGDGVTGLTSDNSDEFIFRVIYGPDSSTTKLAPPNTEYTMNESAPLNDITCIGDCYPICNFKWTKPGTNGELTVNNSAVLSLGTLSRNEAATYTCEVTNANTTVRTEKKQVAVHVNYGPDANTTELTPSSTTYKYNENDSFKDIQCSGICYPSCNYKWTKSGSSTAVNRATLSLGLLDRTKAGIYTCTVSNPTTGSKRTKAVTIFVRYGPDTSTTTLTPARTTYTFVENTHLDDIVCAADCYPECQYIWTKPDNSVVSNNGVLSLGTLKRNEASTYTCTVTRSQTTVSVTKQVFVFVIYGPDAGSVKLNPVERTYTENEGTPLNDITCSTECYPTCSYKWTKSGTHAVVSTSAVLALATLNRDKAATYTCTATNSRKGGTAATDVIVHVRYGPDTCTINSSSPLTLREGESLSTVSCESECYPSCSYTWRNASSNSPIGENGQFQLVKMTRYQAGNYKCLCKNTATTKYVKNQTASLHIIVQYPPDVNVLLSTENITEGNTLILSCDADGVPSVYNYNGLTQTWNGTPVPNTHGEMSDTPRYSTLNIPSLQLQDSGTYTCYVNNGVKTADTVSSVTVKVKVLPKILTHRSQFAGKTDGTVNVSVQFYSYPDIEEVVFKQHDNQTVTNDSAKYIVSHFETTVKDEFYGKDVSLSGMQANLVISNLKQKDFGSYTLILKNGLGKTVTPFTVEAASAPSAPTGFRYLSKAGTHSFTWFGGFNGGKRQTFIIQTSIADQENWQNRTTVTEEMDSQNAATYWANISSLSPGTYSARLFAWNEYGNSDYVSLNSTFTIKEIADGNPFPVAAAIGGSLAGIAVLVISAVSFFMYKRRYGNKDGSQSRLNKGNVTAEGDSDDEDEVNTVNPMYISADEVKPGLSAEKTYAQPVKKNKHDIYALVDKKPKNVQDDLNNLYATPEKKGKEKPQKKEGLKKDKKGRKKKATDGDVYENAPEKAGGTESRNAYDENPYENPEVSAAAQIPQKNVNKDGLIYADLTFNDPPKGQKKLVIHGLDSMTEYVQVDFTKKAEPLPESDEEK